MDSVEQECCPMGNVIKEIWVMSMSPLAIVLFSIVALCIITVFVSSIICVKSEKSNDKAILIIIIAAGVIGCAAGIWGLVIM